ncbi:peptidase S8/S53 domain-containing protein [Xylariaceae sp. FL0016]|nr:peptidase S8/S53 domain-containing protein [Xylariaceae sp. FL0016]
MASDSTIWVEPTPGVVSSSGVIVISSTGTLIVPNGLTATSTLTTDGLTFTLFPSTEGSRSMDSSSGFTMDSTAHSIVQPTAQLTEGSTSDSTNSTAQSTQVPAQVSTSSTSQSTTTYISSLTTFTTWPIAVIIPITTFVAAPTPTDGGSATKCELWFFFICIQIPQIRIGGWRWTLPPGIYPPGPPPFPAFSLPPGLKIQGSLPPWPRITIGEDRLPTYPTQPTDGCTETASICSTTTSLVVSISGTVTTTVATATITPTCGTLTGCALGDEDITASVTSVTSCTAVTNTNPFVTCFSVPGPTSCSNLSTIFSTDTSCEETATTSTVPCTDASVSLPSPAAGIVGPRPPCNETAEYVVWPVDGSNATQAEEIRWHLRILASPGTIREVSGPESGVLIWVLPLNATQGDSLASFPGVGFVHPQCTTNCDDPSTGLRYQLMENQLEQQLPWMARYQYQSDLFYHHQDLGDDTWPFYFDASAGDGIPIYILDTGAQMDHVDFSTTDENGIVDGDNVRDKVSWLHVDVDEDSLTSQDDSDLPRGGILRDSEGTIRADAKAHGTAMLSLAVGKKYGVAKRAKPVLVRLPRRLPNGGGMTISDYVTGLGLISQDLDQYQAGRGQYGKAATAVVLMAFQWPKSYWISNNTGQDFSYYARSTFGRVFRTLADSMYYPSGFVISYVAPTRANFKFGLRPLSITPPGVDNRAEETVPWLTILTEGAILVAGSGNVRPNPTVGVGSPTPNTDIDVYPQLLAVSEPPPDGHAAIPAIDELILVGAVNMVSYNMWASTKRWPAEGLPHVWAPGAPVTVADGNKGAWVLGLPDYRRSYGTSDASALTAGLAAYLLRLGLDERIQVYRPALGTNIDVSPAVHGSGLLPSMEFGIWYHHGLSTLRDVPDASCFIEFIDVHPDFFHHHFTHNVIHVILLDLLHYYFLHDILHVISLDILHYYILHNIFHVIFHDNHFRAVNQQHRGTITFDTYNHADPHSDDTTSSSADCLQ